MWGMCITGLEDNISWTLNDPSLNRDILPATDFIKFFLCYKGMYYALFLVLLLGFRKSKTNFMVPRKCYKIFSQVRSLLLKNFCFGRRLGQKQQSQWPAVASGQKKKNFLRLARDCYLPFHWERDQFLQLGLNYFWDKSLSLFIDI